MFVKQISGVRTSPFRVAGHTGESSRASKVPSSVAVGALLAAVLFSAPIMVPIALGANTSITINDPSNVCNWSWSGSTLTCTPTGAGGAPPASFACNLNGQPAGAVAAGTLVTLTMSCSGGTPPYNYNWSPSAGASGNTLSTNVSTTTTFNVTATDSANPQAQSQKQAQVTVTAGVGGGGGLDCKSVPGSGVTGATTVLDMNWASPQQLRFSGIGPNDAMVVRFTTGSNTSGANLPKISGAEYGTPASSRTAVLSTSACDFSAPPALGWGAVSYGSSVNVYFTVGPNNSGYYPALSPNTTYYLNVRTDPGGACSTSGACNMFFQLSKPGSGY